MLSFYYNLGTVNCVTINVAVKCPDGIVMGADSLVSIRGPFDFTVSSMVPYFTKLFEIKEFSAAAMINGDAFIGGRTVEDIVAEFAENYRGQKTKNYSLEVLTKSLGKNIQRAVDDYGSEVDLEVIVGGYSRGKLARGRRYGELYSIRWTKTDNSIRRSSNTHSIKRLLHNDREFGTHYGGQVKILDRFRFGIDDYTLAVMTERGLGLFETTKRYIINELNKKKYIRNKVKISDDIKIKLPDLSAFDFYSLISEYKIEKDVAKTLKNVKEGSLGKVETMEGVFSLQTAVNYCSFLMWCAFAENAFSFTIPSVGSEMRIATITRSDGFNLIRKWEIQTPGPPFK